MTSSKPVFIRWLGLKPYQPVWDAMKQFTLNRSSDSPDEIWFLEHEPVFTLGQNGKQEHVLCPGSIPVIRTDRGGQVTYHGPGQLMVYPLIDIKRQQFSIRQLVSALEQAMIDYLKDCKTEAYAKCQAPGVYIGEAKIGSIGLRIKRGFSYHGIAFNVAMDLEPFSRINPCGFEKLSMTQLSAIKSHVSPASVAQELCPYLTMRLNLGEPTWVD